VSPTRPDLPAGFFRPTRECGDSAGIGRCRFPLFPCRLRIIELHRDKRALADSILAEGEAAALPSADDLIELIRGQ
jgi:hypothetical protein